MQHQRPQGRSWLPGNDTIIGFVLYACFLGFLWLLHLLGAHVMRPRFK